jgi:hypothetical protein
MKALDPIIKMQELQMRVNAVQMLRSMEIQDHVPPGTYLSTLQQSGAAREPPDDEVKQQVDSWRQRAKAAKAASTVPAGAGDRQ